MLRRYYRDLCDEAIVADIAGMTFRRTKRLLLRALFLLYGPCDAPENEL